jgi:hypothetical protein
MERYILVVVYQLVHFKVGKESQGCKLLVRRADHKTTRYGFAFPRFTKNARQS